MRYSLEHFILNQIFKNMDQGQYSELSTALSAYCPKTTTTHKTRLCKRKTRLCCRRHTIAKPPYTWRISHKLWNKAIHALVGNGTTGGSIIRKLNTQGMPLLKSGDTSPEQFLSWRIDLEGWAATQGISRWISGPLPHTPATDPAKPELLDNHINSVSQGMRYVCTAVQDPNLRASMAIEVSDKTGPACIAWLSKEILQSQAEQPALQQIVDSIELQPKESLVGFKSKFFKFYNALHPRPAPETGCAKFIGAITRNTSFYEDCVTATLSSHDQSNLSVFADSSK